MLAALARSTGANMSTGANIERPPAPVSDNPPAVKSRAAPERAPVEERLAAATIARKAVEAESVSAEGVAGKKPAGEAVAEDGVAPTMSGEPLAEPPAAEHAARKQAEAPGPETAKNLVARLRRQFMEGLPEGRPEAGHASMGSADPKRQAPPRRSPIEEVRFRLSEFRTEILVRAAGRAKPSRRG
jgi:hypothetical protein